MSEDEIEARPFEEYKEMIKSMSKEEMIKGLYDLSKSCIEKDNELERLRKITKQDECDYYVEGLEGLVKEKDKEIERLNKELEEYKKDFNEANDLALKLITNNQEYVCKSIKDTIDILIEKLQQKENIIKEVRELLKRYQNNEYYYKYDGKYLKSEIKKDILEILDKEVNNDGESSNREE